MGDDLSIQSLGQVDYRAGLALQLVLRERVSAGSSSQALLLLEHPAVFTRGRRSQPDELPRGEAWYREHGIDVIDTDRGGKVTYHGPGQLVGYPIMRVDDVLVYLRTMEQAIIAALADLGIEAHRRPGRDFTGVWVQDRKIASIGVHLARGVTSHGFAINVDNDLEPFDWIVACGLPDVRMTSVQAETGRAGTSPELREHIAARFCAAFGLSRVESSAPPAVTA